MIDIQTCLSKSNQDNHNQQINHRKRGQRVRDKNKKNDPPAITTTAATPQDSPNNTMDTAKTLRDLEKSNMEKLEILVSFVLIFFCLLLLRYVPSFSRFKEKQNL